MFSPPLPHFAADQSFGAKLPLASPWREKERKIIVENVR